MLRLKYVHLFVCSRFPAVSNHEILQKQADSFIRTHFLPMNNIFSASCSIHMNFKLNLLQNIQPNDVLHTGTRISQCHCKVARGALYKCSLRGIHKIKCNKICLAKKPIYETSESTISCSNLENSFVHLFGGKKKHSLIGTKHSEVLAAAHFPNDRLMRMQFHRSR